MKKLLVLLFLSGSVCAQTGKLITLNDIFKTANFAQRGVSGLNSMNDGKSYVSIEFDNKSAQQVVARHNFNDGKIAEILYSQHDLITATDTLSLSTDFNNDESKVLIAENKRPIYRRSSIADHYVYDLKTRKITRVSDKGDQSFASFSPDGSKVAFVRNNNIFIKDLVTLAETQITFDGESNKIINGLADWVYEEEFSFAKAFFWSNDSKKIAFYRFDESQVPEFSMTMYNGLYPSEYKYKYPKAGEKNSDVSIHIYNLTTGKTKAVDVGEEKDQYIPRICWTNNHSELCVLRLNRLQNKLDYLIADVNGKSRVMMTEEDKRYIDVEESNIHFLKNGKQFINVSERDGYNHIYLYDMTGKLLRQLTKGAWDVTAIYGIDEKKQVLYYQSAERSALQRDVYSVSFKGAKKLLSPIAGTNSATFSSNYSYFILNHSTANSPAYITLNNNDGKQIRVLEGNDALKKRLSDYAINKTEFFSFKTKSGLTLNGSMIKPLDFDSSRQYPVLMYVYGGPGSQTVADTWGGARAKWFNYLSQQGYIIVSVDGRGTGFRGADFKKATYKQLGKYELDDQVEAARWLATQPYVNPSRIGIWGWSFGGYMSSLCITRAADVFKMAIAVAPVTTWRFYDSIYTERYLQTPQLNAQGYDDNSPINYASQLKGPFLLVHGTGDDNVHFQNSIMFSEALIQSEKQFDQAYYPNKNHGIYGGNTTFQLYTRLTDFILKNL